MTIVTSLAVTDCTSAPLPATGVLSPAPSLQHALSYDCGTQAVGLVRFEQIDPASLVEVMDGHLPTWLPDGMGLAEAYGEGWFHPGGLGGARLRDAACRVVEIRYYASTKEI